MSQGKCICHQCSGDSWSCPEHYQDNRRFRETQRIIELCTGHLPATDYVFMVIRKIDAENAERSRAFFRELNEELDRRDATEQLVDRVRAMVDGRG